MDWGEVGKKDAGQRCTQGMRFRKEERQAGGRGVKKFIRGSADRGVPGL